MPTAVANPLRKLAPALPKPDRRRVWHYVWLAASWACLLVACVRLWQMLDGRMYYLLDSDMSSELVLSHQLRMEHALVSPNWFYSTELRVYNIHWAFTPLFLFFDNWLVVRKIGTAFWLLAMLASCFYCCWQAGLRHLFAAVGALLLCPLSDVYFRILLLTLSYAPYVVADFICLGLMFQFAKTKSRRGGAVLLVLLWAFSLLLGTNGLRQVLIFYLPIALAALCLVFVRSAKDPAATLPGLERWDARFAVSALSATGFTLVGWRINVDILSHIYHYTSQEGVKFQNFSLERLQDLVLGWLETFGYRAGAYITSTDLLYNAFALLGMLVYVCALGSLVRRPRSYTKPEQVLYLLSGFAFLVYNGLYLFTDMVYYTRYNIPIAVLMMPVVVDYLYRLPKCRVYRAAIFVVLTGLLAWCVQSYYVKLWPRNMTQAHEEAVAALRVAGYTEGYATFWNANIMVELSNGAFDIRVWEPGQDITDPDVMYHWLQSTEHETETPEGPVFVFLNKNEAEYETPAARLDAGETVYENDNYIALGYESYEAMKADFAE